MFSYSDIAALYSSFSSSLIVTSLHIKSKQKSTAHIIMVPYFHNILIIFYCADSVSAAAVVSPAAVVVFSDDVSLAVVLFLKRA